MLNKYIGKRVGKTNIGVNPTYTNRKVNILGEITKLNKQTPKSESLRTTIPFSIIKQFGLTEYDELDWSLVVEGSELIIRVKPIKTGKKA
jgi:hypothetical protein